MCIRDRRVVTVAGDCVPEAQNLLCRFGTPLEHIFAEAGADMSRVERICMGGPMMGICVADPTAGSVKGDVYKRQAPHTVRHAETL